MKFFYAAIVYLASMATAVAEQTQVGKNVAGNMDSFSMLLSLFMVLGLIIVCALVLKKFQHNQQHISGMKVVSTLHLTTKEKLVVVEIAGKQMLLGVTAHQITKLEALDEPLELNQGASTSLTNSWAQIKKNVLKQ